MSAMEVNRARPSAAARAEAAAWVARLHGPNRTREVEAGLRRWLAEDPEKAAAFELLTETWEKSAQLRRRPIEQVASWERPGFRISFSRAALVTAATFILAVAATILYFHTDAVTTGIGELRVITLDDGTRVHLNTATQARIRYDKQFRRVSLERGEALFEVARRTGWPFIVTAGERQITALGTEFVVRRNDHGIEVTLVEGKVTVSPDAASGAEQGAGPAAQQAGGQAQAAQSPQTQVFTLVPGERLTFAGTNTAKIDRPALERVTAWERGEVALDNTLLGEAVTEMNRYSRQKIVIEDPALAAIRVSGIFQAGDSANFAQAVARTYHMRVLHQPDAILLATGGAR
jgi:transmembrane sensor